MRKAAWFNFAFVALLAAPFATANVVRIENVCNGAKIRRAGNDILLVCPNGRVAIRIQQLCVGGVLRAYYGRDNNNWLVCNSDDNPLVMRQPDPAQTIRLR